MSWVPRPLRVAGFRLGSASPIWPVEPADLWVHGASMGEIAAAGSLVSCLGEDPPTVYLTSGTPEGLARAERRGYGHGRGPGPFDRLGTRRLLSRLKPKAIWLVESELWPGLLWAARSAGVPVGVVGARVSDRTYQRCQRSPGNTWFSMVGHLVHRYATADARSARRLARLGIPEDRIRHCGRIKIPARPDPDAPIARLLQRLAPGRQWVVGGCVRANEAARLLETGTQPLLLAPRHLERLAEIEQTVRRYGFVPVRRSAEPRRLGDREVLVLDTLGELADAYTAARWTLLGGSVDGPRAHDLLEPMVGGSRVLAGPHLEHQEDEADWLRGARVLEEFAGSVPVHGDDPLDVDRLLGALDGRQATITWMRGGGLL